MAEANTDTELKRLRLDFDVAFLMKLGAMRNRYPDYAPVGCQGMGSTINGMPTMCDNKQFIVDVQEVEIDGLKQTCLVIAVEYFPFTDHTFVETYDIPLTSLADGELHFTLLGRKR